MSNEESDTLEIADLEYDVGGVGAVEPSDASIGMDGILVVMVVPK